MASAFSSISERFKANNAAQAANQLMRIDCDSDKEALLEVLDDYFYGDVDERLEDELEDMELSDTVSEYSKGVYNNFRIN